MKHTILLLITGIAIGAVLADQKTNAVTPDPVDAIIQKSHETMRKASAVSARADQQVAQSISKMKETIEVLKEEKEQLVEQVKVMENEIVAVKAVATAQPFDVLAIVPDSASRK